MPDDRYSILVVDDVRLDREILREFLRKMGFYVRCAEDGLEALEVLDSEPFDLVLLDIVMPRMYGSKVLQIIRANPRLNYMPVLMMTSVNDTESAAHCIELGADDYLVKPHNKTLLKARIHNCIQKKNFREQEKMMLRKVEEEKQMSDRLLMRIMPKAIADKLKKGQRIIVDYFSEVTVMFSDIVGYTKMSATLPEDELIKLLHSIYSSFDELTFKHGLEKIKTIGDSYMVVGGIPNHFDYHAEAIANMALDMKAIVKQYRTSLGKPISMRFGINTGPVRVGIIGTRKFSYDLWGDTVNIASRMESHGLPDQIHVTHSSRKYLRDKFVLEQRDKKIHVKGVGPMTSYFLTGRQAKATILAARRRAQEMKE